MAKCATVGCCEWTEKGETLCVEHGVEAKRQHIPEVGSPGYVHIRRRRRQPRALKLPQLLFKWDDDETES